MPPSHEVALAGLQEGQIVAVRASLFPGTRAFVAPQAPTGVQKGVDVAVDLKHLNVVGNGL